MVHKYTCGNVIVERRPDIVIVNKMEKTAIIIDVAIPEDKRIIEEEMAKTEKCQNLKKERDFGTLKLT